MSKTKGIMRIILYISTGILSFGVFAFFSKVSRGISPNSDMIAIIPAIISLFFFNEMADAITERFFKETNETRNPQSDKRW